MAETSIEWTDTTWNPVRGCSRISPGCEGCYAEGIAYRFSGPGLAYEGLATLTKKGPRWTGDVRVVDDALEAPLHWRKARKVFVNSQSDLFHESLSDAFIDRVFAIMQACPQHTFQVLTKRAARMAAWARGAEERVGAAGELLASEKGWCHAHEDRPWPLSNVHLGVSVESQRYADERIPHLLATPAAVRFLSCEPLLGSVDLRQVVCPGCGAPERRPDPEFDGFQCRKCLSNYLEGERVKALGPNGIDWVIVGGESGNRARPFDLDWARSIRDQCAAAGVAFFFKQAGRRPQDAGQLIKLRHKKGSDLAELPADLRVREFPGVARG